jgi:hypothetical protein
MNRGREKAGAGVQGPHPLDKILGEKRRASSSNNYARAFFRGEKMQKSQESRGENR